MKRGISVGQKVCLTKDESVRGIIVVHVQGGCWTVEYAEGERRNHKAGELNVLESQDGAFVASRAARHVFGQGESFGDE